jgi:hypothetical protein
MSDEFQIPAAPSDLLEEDGGAGLKVLRDVSLADLTTEDIADLADGESHVWSCTGTTIDAGFAS